MRKIFAIFALIIGASFMLTGCGDKKTEESYSLWNFEELAAAAPAVTDAGYTFAGNDNIKGIYFTGAEYNGEATNVFAYVGVPTTQKPAAGYPAMVLVHGGLGRAFPDWVKLWTDRGYVAIALSVDGNITDASNINATDNPDGGPKISITPTDMTNPKNSWEYISVANVIACNNILRARDDVDKSNIGITGISWGSYLTCITVGVDDRFKFGIPVYGAGFMDEDVSSALKDVFALDDENLAIYQKSFDPAAYMKNNKIPLMWFTGANDASFSIACNQKCADLSQGTNEFSWRASLTHGQQPGDGSGLPEIFEFADRMVLGTDTNMLRLKNDKVSDGVITVERANSVDVATAKLYYSDYPLEYWHEPGNTWKSSEVLTLSDNKFTIAVPDGAVYGFIQVTDENGFIVSSRCFSF